MKESIVIQSAIGESEFNSLKASIKDVWKQEGGLVKDIKAINYYVKPDEGKCYFVINDDFSGSVDLF